MLEAKVKTTRHNSRRHILEELVTVAETAQEERSCSSDVSR